MKCLRAAHGSLLLHLKVLSDAERESSNLNTNRIVWLAVITPPSFISLLPCSHYPQSQPLRAYV